MIPIFFFTTIFVFAILTLGRVTEARRTARVAQQSEFSQLPDQLRRVVEATLAELPDGEARRQLLNVLVQARPILASHSTTFDEAEEAKARANVESLITACCDAASDLNRLAAVSAASAATPHAPELEARFTAAHDMLAKRMCAASEALAALYVAGLQQDTSASQRVAQLADEIAADAWARSAAAAEMEQLLRGRASDENHA